MVWTMPAVSGGRHGELGEIDPGVSSDHLGLQPPPIRQPYSGAWTAGDVGVGDDDTVGLPDDARPAP